MAKYGQVYRTDVGAPSRLFWSHQNSAAVPRPSRHQVSALALLTLHQLRQGAPDACRGGEWTGERLSTRVGEIGRNELTELGIQGAALNGEVRSPWAWCCMMRSAPRPRRLQGRRSAMGIWPRFLFPLVPNSLAWCCMETGFPPRAPVPPAHPPLPCPHSALRRRCPQQPRGGGCGQRQEGSGAFLFPFLKRFLGRLIPLSTVGLGCGGGKEGEQGAAPGLGSRRAQQRQYLRPL
uniref:Uncharacterized protein n=1 Tax=Pipistrellus kuhlii TaxID=59472 RepID=A0A7J7YMK8_PIPKU|nr:hypothetical protein mPipKuh1_010159 [Pipistrellus kuhlii]